MDEVLVEAFLSSLAAEGRSPRTLEWHRNSFRQFSRWIEEQGLSGQPSAWTPAMMREYILHTRSRVSERSGKRLSDESAASLVRSLRAFCRWLLREELVDLDIFSKVRIPSPPRREQRVLTAEEVETLIKAVRTSSRRPLRDEALILFALDTAARSGEICGLRLADVDWQRRTVTVTGKGKKQRLLPFSPVTAKALLRYTTKERGSQGDRLFLANMGRPLTVGGVAQLFGRLRERTGIPVHAHMLRHTAATEYARSGANAMMLQKLLGHSSIHTSLIYTHLTNDSLVEAHAAHSPLEGLRSRKGRRSS